MDKINEDIEEINCNFQSFFKELNFHLTFAGEFAIKFSNNDLILDFRYDIRYGRQFDGVVITFISNNLTFNLQELINFHNDRQDMALTLKTIGDYSYFLTISNYSYLVTHELKPYFLNLELTNQQMLKYLKSKYPYY